MINKLTGLAAGICGLTLLISCGEPTANETPKAEEKKDSSMSVRTTGGIEKLDPSFDNIIEPGTAVEILTEGFDWSEGPLWISGGNYLLFSDIPPNKIYKWSEADGLQDYLHPSGYTGITPRGGEPGSNGLLLDKDGRLVLCQHGDRRMARMDAPLDSPEAKFVTLAYQFMGKRLNSPNDAVFKSNGDLYFTDPSYGLEKRDEDPGKELPFKGVYRVKPDGMVDLLTKDIKWPNGIAFSPDESKLYVASSDPDKAIWMVYDLDAKGGIKNGRIFYDCTEASKKEKGVPDGMKVDKQGNVFGTGPGGVWIFNSSGKVLGKIKTGQATSNCAFNADETELYITADMYLLRVKLKKR
jgi:gluconolactonase